ncbi:MAG: hypothetical protein ACXVC6_05895 [Bacteroidia bacterium]
MNYLFPIKYKWKELEDYAWFPAFLRSFQTEFIGFLVKVSGVYKPFVRYMRALKMHPVPMFDLCSGSGEPAITIYKSAGVFSSLTLSDKFPNINFNDRDVLYSSEKRDVNEMKFSEGICYTMFNAFHHFTDTSKLSIVEEISKRGASAYFVEILKPDMSSFLKVSFLTTVGNLILAPFVKPFSVARLFFTYLLPVNIITVLYDGIVSVFKSRSLKTYSKLFADKKFVNVFELRGLVIIEVKQC